MFPWNKCVQPSKDEDMDLNKEDLEVICTILDEAFHQLVKVNADADATKVKKVLDKCLTLRARNK